MSSCPHKRASLGVWIPQQRVGYGKHVIKRLISESWSVCPVLLWLTSTQQTTVPLSPVIPSEIFTFWDEGQLKDLVGQNAAIRPARSLLLSVSWKTVQARSTFHVLSACRLGLAPGYLLLHCIAIKPHTFMSLHAPNSKIFLFSSHSVL